MAVLQRGLAKLAADWDQRLPSRPVDGNGRLGSRPSQLMALPRESE
jgi:hypothetical protein